MPRYRGGRSGMLNGVRRWWNWSYGPIDCQQVAISPPLGSLHQWKSKERESWRMDHVVSRSETLIFRSHWNNAVPDTHAGRIMPLSEEKLSDLQLREDCYGDSSVKSKVTESGLSQHRHRDRHHYHQHHSRHSHLDSKSAADQKHTAPLLTSPPGLIRRFADCDLTGDCQINETAPLESELPTGSSIPGDNRFSQTSTKLLVSGSGWRGRLFRTFWVCDDRLSSATRVNVQATVTIPHAADRPTNLVVLSSHRLWVKEDGKVRRTMLSKGIEFFCTALNQVGVEGVVHRRS